MKVYVPGDSASRSVGSDRIVDAIRARRPDLTILRPGSRGLYGLEPLIEIDYGNGRIGYGPLSVSEAEDIIQSDQPLEDHEKYLGLIENHELIAQQTRLTFERVGKSSPWIYKVMSNTVAGPD